MTVSLPHRPTEESKIENGIVLPNTGPDHKNLYEVLLAGFREVLLADSAANFWQAYTKHIPPGDLDESPEWRAFLTGIESDEEVSSSLRNLVAGYLKESRDLKREADSRADSGIVSAEPSRDSCASPMTPLQSQAREEKDERAGYPARLRAARGWNEKIAALIEESEREMRAHQQSRKDLEQLQKDSAESAKQLEALGEECQLLKGRVKMLESKDAVREGQRLQREDDLRTAREEISRLRILHAEKDKEIDRLGNSVQEMTESLKTAALRFGELERDRLAIQKDAETVRADRDRIAAQHDASIEAEKRITTQNIAAEVRSRISNIVSLQWNSAYSLAETADEREALEILKRRLVEVTRDLETRGEK